MDFVARQMKKQGEILDFRFDPVSGKLKVRFPSRNLRPPNLLGRSCLVVGDLRNHQE
jgi:hypothetical protein